MPIAMLLLSVIAAAVGGVVVWTMAGFWWALAAYSGTGAVTMLLLAALQAFPAPRGNGARPHYGKPEIAG